MSVSLDSGPVTAGAVLSGVTVDLGVFAPLVQAVAVAAGADDTLPALTGVRVEWDGTRLSLAAADRYRLTVGEVDGTVVDYRGQSRQAVTPTGGDAGEGFAFLVPAKALVEVVKTATAALRAEWKGKDRNVAYAVIGAVSLTVSDDGTALTVAYGPAVREDDGRLSLVRELGSRRIDLLVADFPNFRALVPSEDMFEASDGVGRISFNPMFLADLGKCAKLLAPKNTPVTVRFTAADRPAVWTVPTEDGVSFLYLLMPVRLAG